MAKSPNVIGALDLDFPRAAGIPSPPLGSTLREGQRAGKAGLEFLPAQDPRNLSYGLDWDPLFQQHSLGKKGWGPMWVSHGPGGASN